MDVILGMCVFQIDLRRVCIIVTFYLKYGHVSVGLALASVLTWFQAPKVLGLSWSQYTLVLVMAWSQFMWS